MAWTNPEPYPRIDVYRNSVKIYTISRVGITSYSDTDADSNVTYTYYLEPYNTSLVNQGASNTDTQTSWADSLPWYSGNIETVTCTDTLNDVANFGDAFTDTVACTDTLGQNLAFPTAFTETVTCTDTLLELVVLEWNYGVYFAKEAGNVYEYSSDYVADGSTAINCMYQTKALDFGDSNPELADMIKITDKIKITYKDRYADTPIIVSVSNDGLNWTEVTHSVGTGAETIKTKDFYFRHGSYVTGRLLRYKIEWGSATTTTEIMGIEITIIPLGKSLEI